MSFEDQNAKAARLAKKRFDEGTANQIKKYAVASIMAMAQKDADAEKLSLIQDKVNEQREIAKANEERLVGPDIQVSPVDLARVALAIYGDPSQADLRITHDFIIKCAHYLRIREAAKQQK
jgi:hypothetical protein